MTSRYGWIVDVDHLDDNESTNDVGVIGPHDIAPGIEAALKAGKGLQWRTYDDDDIKYYTGRMILPDDAEDWEQNGPLRDFAGPGAGAVVLKYRDKYGSHVLEW